MTLWVTPIRGNEVLIEVPWNEAIDVAAFKCQEIMAKGSHKVIAGLSRSHAIQRHSLQLPIPMLFHSRTAPAHTESRPHTLRTLTAAGPVTSFDLGARRLPFGLSVKAVPAQAFPCQCAAVRTRVREHWVFRNRCCRSIDLNPLRSFISENAAEPGEPRR